MASEGDNEQKTQNPTEFFQSIGNKVESLAPDANGTAADGDDERAVEEVESLCMNCGKNVSQSTLWVSS